VLGSEQIEQFEDMYEKSPSSAPRQYLASAGFYIKHNAGIGLQCFALGPLILPSLCMLAYNGVVLGATFGYMARADVEQGDNFMEFVTAHGAFELTAIALSAAAGLRIGVGLFSTRGLSRSASFRLNAERSLPLILCSVILFVLAAFTEGCLSPSPVSYSVKKFFAMTSSMMLILFFLLQGFPTSERLESLQFNEDNPWRER
jgi:hypothetical protein